jgi:hypothetical protein
LLAPFPNSRINFLQAGANVNGQSATISLSLVFFVSLGLLMLVELYFVGLWALF